ncbi:type II CRISPR RNA-guided endonuclease Cas9 [Metamycoplasma equirhinis]|uniref:type II CRISPR RNA-guided endonuclease Cas9 n=1 Tax=Metamycoplasma equirhinis TaxID=92402 RepID=UPI0035946300
MTKEEITIGFDLGVGSVGWAIINNDNKIINWGSRLFSEPQLAEDRRIQRSIRRMHRRKQYKNEKFYNIVLRYKEEFGFSSKEEIKNAFIKLTKKYPNIIFLKKKIFENKSLITKNELLWLLHDYFQNRGYFYEIIETAEKEKPKKSEKSIDAKYKNDYSGELPTQKQIDFFSKNGFFKNSQAYGTDDYSSAFSNKKFTEELKLLFKKTNVSSEFQDSIITLFTFCRSYADGPGSKNSVSPYGRFYYDENNNLCSYENIWSKLIGKCSYFPDQLRAPKSSCYGELFNLLEDLVNFRFFENLYSKNKLKITEVISKANFYDLLDKMFNNNKIQNLTISKLLGKINKKTEINYEVYKKNSDGTKFTELNSISKLFKIISKYYADVINKHLNFKNIIELLNEDKDTILDEFDQIIEILSNCKTKEDRYEKISLIFENFKILRKKLTNDDIFHNLLIELSEIPGISSKRASLSIKAYKKFIPKIYYSLENYESLKWNEIKERNITTENRVLQNAKYMSDKFLDNAILPPSVRTTICESVRVLNKIIKLYSKKYTIKNVVIELAREKNSEDERKYIKKIQKLQENRKNKIIEQMKSLDIPGFSIDDITTTKLLKLILFFQQDQIDIYSGEKLDIEKVWRDSSYCEIDHIIPYSLSADDSFSNKVLVKRTSNQLKGQQLPIQYIRKHETENWNIAKFKKYVNEQFGKQMCELLSFEEKFSKKQLDKKKHILLLEEYEPSGFLSRNINDTRYATKLFKNNLLEFANKRFGVQNLNGNVTSFFRKKAREYWEIESAKNSVKNLDYEKKYELLNDEKYQVFKKDRNKFLHHAVDAAIIALISKNNPSLKSLTIEEEQYAIYNEKTLINVETGELKNISSSKIESKYWNIEKTAEIIFKSIFDSIWSENMPKFSRKVLMDSNTSLFNSTIYALKEINNNEFYKIEKLNLFDETTETLDKFFASAGNENDKAPNLLICRSHNSEYVNLKEIYDEWKTKIDKKQNPFIAYMKNLCENCEDIDPAYIKTLYAAKKVFVTKNASIFRSLKYISNKIDKNNLILNKKQQEKSFNDTLNSLGCLIYKNKEDKYSKIPLNAKLMHFNSNIPRNLLDENIYFANELELQKRLNNIPISSKPIKYINKTMCIKNNLDDSLWYISGIPTAGDKIEIKRIDRRILDLKEDATDLLEKQKDKRFRKSIKIIMTEFSFVDIDELGNF